MYPDREVDSDNMKNPPRDNTKPDAAELVPRGEGGKWLPGTSPNPGGRSRRLREIEDMLDAEHRTVENMREAFGQLRAMALGEIVEVKYKGKVVGIQLKCDPAFMKLYLERILGPVADGEVIDSKVEKRLRELLEMAEQEARKNRTAIDVEEAK